MLTSYPTCWTSTIRNSGFDHLLEISKQSPLELAEKPEEEHGGFEVDWGLELQWTGISVFENILRMGGGRQQLDKELSGWRNSTKCDSMQIFIYC